jgi:transposase
MRSDLIQRKHLLFQDWPQIDQRAWNALFEVGDIFADAGRACHWRPATRRTNRQHYARWLGHLSLSGETQPERAPDARVTPERVLAYAAHLTQTVAPRTAASNIIGLKVVMKAMAPETDWRWLMDLSNRLNIWAMPVVDRTRAMRPVEEIHRAAQTELDRLLSTPLRRRLDRPKLKPLPVEPYVFAEWRIRRVGIDYHVEVEKHFYSVPFRFARQEVEARITARTVEVFAKGERIAAHIRSSGNGGHTTLRDHMPSSHRRHGDWTIDRIRKEACLVGAATGVLCELILERRSHPEQGFRTCIGILRLAKPFGALRLEAAAERAIEIGTLSYSSVRSILDKRLDQTGKRQEPGSDAAPILHPNIRGPRYYQ